MPAGVSPSSGKGRMPVELTDETGPVSITNPLSIREHSVSDASNSVNDGGLLAGGVFTGEWFDTLHYSVIQVAIWVDQVSATDGLRVQWSSDQVDIHDEDLATIPASKGKSFSYQPVRRYMRIKYTNGPTPQTHMDLETTIKADYVKPSSHRISDNIVGDDDAELSKAVITGIDPGGIFRNAMVTTEGRLDVSSLNEKIQIARGLIVGFEPIEKFGRNSDVDIADVNQQIWSRSIDWVAPTASRIHDIVSTSANDTVAGTGARTVLVVGLDMNWDPQSETVTSDGLTPVPTIGSYVIIHRMQVVTCGTGKTNVGTITATAQTDATVTAEILAGKGKTLMAIYGVRAGYSLYLEQVYGYLNTSPPGAAGYPGAILELKAVRDADTATGCESVEHVWGLAARGNSSNDHPFRVSKVIPEKSIIYISAESVTDDNSDISAGFDGYLIID